MFWTNKDRKLLYNVKEELAGINAALSKLAGLERIRTEEDIPDKAKISVSGGSLDEEANREEKAELMNSVLLRGHPFWPEDDDELESNDFS